MPIDYAILGGFLPAVTALAAAGSPILLTNYDLWVLSHELLRNNNITDEIFQEICLALVQRRVQLEKLAVDHLSPDQDPRLRNAAPGVLDRCAAEVYLQLKRCGLDVPEALRVPPLHVSMYHCLPLTVSRVKILYACGFQDVDLLDGLKYTPLMTSMYRFDDIGVYEELLSKGADLTRIVTDFGSTQAHYLAGRILRKYDPSIYDRDFSSLKVFLRILVPEVYCKVRDSCRCYCSIVGCSPFDVLFRTFFSISATISWRAGASCRICQANWRSDEQSHQSKCIPALRKGCSLFLQFCWDSFSQDGNNLKQLDQQIIRHSLFVALGITHTCCVEPASCWTSVSKRMSPDTEIVHIHEEEKELLSELETLCKEANIRWAEYCGPFGDFIFDFLDEVDTRPTKPLIEEDFYKITDIGVCLDLRTVRLEGNGSNAELDRLDSAAEDAEDETEDEWEDAIEG